MHEASNLNNLEYCRYGFDVKKKFNWKKLVTNIQNYIKSINENYYNELCDRIDYYNGYAKYVDNQTIECEKKDGKKVILKCKRSVVAVGGRPKYLGVKNDNLCVTSDELFSLKKQSKKVLIIGGSYIAMETAGFLNGLGSKVVVLVRSKILKGFDEECVNLLVEDMKMRGIEFREGELKGGFERVRGGIEANGEVYDEVVLAVGREPFRDYNTIGLKVNEVGKVISVGRMMDTSVKDVYVVGDVMEGEDELATVAIEEGRVLMERLYGGGKGKLEGVVPTTVFTPLEYSCVGMTEMEAREKFEGKVDVYYRRWRSLEEDFGKSKEFNFVKMVVVKGKLVGMHLIGKKSSEIIQGFLMQINKKMFQNVVGIHPTTAEGIFKLKARGC